MSEKLQSRNITEMAQQNAEQSALMNVATGNAPSRATAISQGQFEYNQAQFSDENYIEQAQRYLTEGARAPSLSQIDDLQAIVKKTERTAKKEIRSERDFVLSRLGRTAVLGVLGGVDRIGELFGVSPGYLSSGAPKMHEKREQERRIKGARDGIIIGATNRAVSDYLTSHPKLYQARRRVEDQLNRDRAADRESVTHGSPRPITSRAKLASGSSTWVGSVRYPAAQRIVTT